MQLKYYLIISASFDRDPIVFDNEPSEKEIEEHMIRLQGTSARIEKRYILTDK